MASLSLSDLSNLSLTFPPSGRSAFLKYLQSPDTIQMELSQQQAADGLLDKFLPSGINVKVPVKLGASGDALTIRSGIEGNLGIKQGTLFNPATDDYGDALAIPQGQAYLSACFKASLGAGGSLPSGDLQFGFDAGTVLALTNYRLFTADTKITSALQSLLQDFTVPRDLDDLESMAAGDVVTLEGTGTLKFSATANLLAVTNPLASLSLLSTVSLAIKQKGEVSVGANVTLTGGYQIRVRRLAAKKVELGFEKKRSQDLVVNVSAVAQLSGGVESFDLIPTLFKAISNDPDFDKETFGHQTGLTGSEIDTIADAVKAGIDRNLALALSGEVESCAGSSAAFSYEIDLAALDEPGKASVLAALQGDLRGLEGADVAGIRRLRSAFDSLREGKHTLKVNLLGIFNFGSVTDLLSKGKLIVDRETGAITVADRATANRISFTSDNFAKDSAKLRTVVASSVTLTAAYSVGGALTQMPDFTCGCWSFESHQKTGRKNLQHYLHTEQALGLLSDAEAASKTSSISQAPDDDFGPSTFHIESTYGSAAFQNMFCDPAGQPRTQEDYENLGRAALRVLLPPDDPSSAVRRRPLEDAALWAALREAGSWQNIAQALKAAGIDTVIAPVIAGDCDLILWWAEAMSGMAKAIGALTKYLAGHPAPNPEDGTVKKLRKDLDDAMAAVCKDAQPRFGEPWGLLVMQQAASQGPQASGKQGSTTAKLVNSHLAFVATWPRAALAEASGGPVRQVMAAGA